MIELIREWFELTAKKNWLKTIDRAVNKYNRLRQEATAQSYIVRKLLDKYNDLYPSDKIKISPRREKPEGD